MLADHELKELRFSCQQCGKCCGGESGFVLFSAEDVQNIIGILGISEKRFFKKYTRIVTHQGESYLSLKEKTNNDCIFLESGKCVIYEARPFQCRSYPFWNRILKSRYSWKNEKKYCDGIGEGEPAGLEPIGTWIVGERLARGSYLKPDSC